MNTRKPRHKFQLENSTLEARNLMTVMPLAAQVSKLGMSAIPIDYSQSISAAAVQKQATGTMMGKWSIGMNKLIIASAQGTFPIRKYNIAKDEYANATTFAKLSEPLILNYGSKDTVSFTLVDRKGGEIMLTAGITSQVGNQRMIRMTLKYESSSAYNGVYMKGTMQVTVMTKSPVLQIRFIQDQQPV
jgi:hypothetical protein